MPTSTELTFDPEGHVYRMAGRVVPSVTQILDQLQLLRGIPREQLEAAARFGTNVHIACDHFDRDDLDERALDPALAPYVADWRNFISDTGFVVTESEVPVLHEKLGYAGTPDKRGLWRNASWVLDIKSGAIPFTVGMQTIAYQRAMPTPPRRRGVVQLTGSGYKFRELKNPADWSNFLSTLNVYHLLKKAGKLDAELNA
jgi:hypothetical protein